MIFFSNQWMYKYNDKHIHAKNCTSFEIDQNKEDFLYIEKKDSIQA